MSEKQGLDEFFPKHKIVVPIVIFLFALVFLLVGIGVLGGVVSTWELFLAAAFTAIGIGYLCNARWARFLAGVAFALAGLALAIFPIVKVISAGPFTAEGYISPFEDFSPLMMIVIILIGIGIAGFGAAIIAFVFAKKKNSTTKKQVVCPFCAQLMDEDQLSDHVSKQCRLKPDTTKH